MASKPGPHPAPSTHFRELELPLCSLDKPLFRIHRKLNDPVFFGCTGSNRFDDPLGEFGVLYAGLDIYAAFIETHGVGTHGQRTNANVITEAELRDRCLTEITPNRSLNLVDLTGAGLSKIGADNRLASADHEIAQLWSRAIWDHPAHVDGIHFRTRHDPGRIAVAIFNRGIEWQKRASGSLIESGNEALLGELLDHYGFALIS